MSQQENIFIHSQGFSKMQRIRDELKPILPYIATSSLDGSFEKVLKPIFLTYFGETVSYERRRVEDLRILNLGRRIRDKGEAYQLTAISEVVPGVKPDVPTVFIFLTREGYFGYSQPVLNSDDEIRLVICEQDDEFSRQILELLEFGFQESMVSDALQSIQIAIYHSIRVAESQITALRHIQGQVSKFSQ